MVQLGHIASNNDLVEKSEEEIRTRLRKTALIFSIVGAILWLLEKLIFRVFDVEAIHLFGLFYFIDVLTLRVIYTIWIIKNSKALKIEKSIWLVFGLFTPIVSAFFIGISKDNDPYAD